MAAAAFMPLPNPSEVVHLDMQQREPGGPREEIISSPPRKVLSEGGRPDSPPLLIAGADERGQICVTNGSSEERIFIWARNRIVDKKTNQVHARQVPASNLGVRSLAFVPANKQLVAGTQCGHLVIYKLYEGLVLQSVVQKVRAGWIVSLASEPSEGKNRFISLDTDGKVALWTPTVKGLYTERSLGSVPTLNWTVCWSAGGEMVLIPAGPFSVCLIPRAGAIDDPEPQRPPSPSPSPIIPLQQPAVAAAASPLVEPPGEMPAAAAAGAELGSVPSSDVLANGAGGRQEGAEQQFQAAELDSEQGGGRKRAREDDEEEAGKKGAEANLGGDVTMETDG
mmetsp:Transcript_15362/g.31169  ORF Transcript_15362/g.31169 Transcript_15362/m.31169 type:complete len:338 (+) Transcript_15362:354-1367(+)